jgi:hypothetical protein
MVVGPNSLIRHEVLSYKHRHVGTDFLKHNKQVRETCTVHIQYSLSIECNTTLGLGNIDTLVLRNSFSPDVNV